MNADEDFCKMVRDWQWCEHVGGVHRLSTFVQLPSGSVVNVTVRRSGERWIVSDSASAIEEAASAGIDKPSLGLNIRRALRSRGLVFNDGRIETPPVETDALQAAVISVANVCRDIAEALIMVGRNEREESLDNRARRLLVTRFHTWVLSKPVIIRGQSEKEHKFDNCVILPDGRKILVDSVNKHANSINSVVVSNIDIQRLNDTSILQRIVFDPREMWENEDISLLGVAATPVALPMLTKSLEKISA